MCNFHSIPTYIINLKSRVDRKQYILKEFSGHDEFALKIVSACEHEKGAIGLWLSLKNIIENLTNPNDEFILICEDDHQFTDFYAKEVLFDGIINARHYNADILCGGVSWFNSTVHVQDNLFWVQKFSGLQFTVIFRKFFKVILGASFTDTDAADFKISDLSENKYLIHPFISVQKEFGYSDVTTKNNQAGRVDELFDKSSVNIKSLKTVISFYKAINEKINEENETEVYENISLPTYVINLPERSERLEHIKNQFYGKAEFELTIVEACKHEIGAFGLWKSIRKAVELAIKTDDDVILICEDDHEFTESYSKEYLLKNIIGAHQQGANLLLGGIGYFSLALPVAKSRFWINPFFSTQFMVIFRDLFQKILDEPFDEKVTADGILSELTSNKMVIFPFVSIQKEFGYSDVTSTNNKAGLVTKLFTDTAKRLEMIKGLQTKIS